MVIHVVAETTSLVRWWLGVWGVFFYFLFVDLVVCVSIVVVRQWVWIFAASLLAGAGERGLDVWDFLMEFPLGFGYLHDLFGLGLVE
jgi:hypothetical protein